MVSYLVLARGSKEHRELLLRAKAIDRFLHKIEVFQLEHGHNVEREWDEKVKGFHLDLENILRNRSIMINSGAAVIQSGPGEGAGATDTALGLNETHQEKPPALARDNFNKLARIF